MPTPPEIVEAANVAMTEGKTKYTAIVGTSELRRAICDKFERDNGAFRFLSGMIPIHSCDCGQKTCQGRPF